MYQYQISEDCKGLGPAEIDDLLAIGSFGPADRNSIEAPRLSFICFALLPFLSRLVCARIEDYIGWKNRYIFCELQGARAFSLCSALVSYDMAATAE